MRRWSMWAWLLHEVIRRHTVSLDTVEFDDGSGTAYFDCSCGAEWELEFQ